MVTFYDLDLPTVTTEEMNTSDLNASDLNSSGDPMTEFNADTLDPLFQDLTARFLLIFLYSVVFCLCFFGNIVIIGVMVVRSKRMKSLGYFLLTNLAVADLFVGIFCVYPNMLTFLYIPWRLGQFGCKFYYYAQAVSYSVSILTLMAMSVERYMATLRPLTSRHFLRKSSLAFWVYLIWLLSATLNIPHLLIYDVVNIGDNTHIEHCFLIAKGFQIEIYVTVHFIIWFCVPVILLTFCHVRISYTLMQYRAKRTEDDTTTTTTTTTATTRFLSECGETSSSSPVRTGVTRNGTAGQSTPASVSCIVSNIVVRNKVLRSRRRVIRLLMVMVLCFAITMLPYEIRVMWQTWGDFGVEDTGTKVFTIFTYLLYYANSAIHPILYAFLSQNFRKTMWSTLCVPQRCRRSTRQEPHLVVHYSKRGSRN